MVKKNVPNTISISTLFEGLQASMMESLTQGKKITFHAPTKGRISEINWHELFNVHLPKRYGVEKNIFVIDVNGQISQEIDLIIFDRQYSPFLFKKDGVQYIPAESVYAVFEVKPAINKKMIEYAGEKVKSVRILKRTSAPVPNIYGTAKPKKPHRILAGILTLNSEWKDPFGKSFKTVIESLPNKARIDIGCALQCGAFDFQLNKTLTTSKPQKALMHFFLNLLGKLQRFGTVAALDFFEYLKQIDK